MAKVGGSNIPSPFDKIFAAARRNADQFNMKYIALVAMSEKTGRIVAESSLRGTGESLKKIARTRAENLRKVIRGEIELDEDRRVKVDFMTRLLACGSSAMFDIQACVELTKEDDEKVIISAASQKHSGDMSIACIASALKEANFQLGNPDGKYAYSKWGPVPPGIRRRSTFDVKDISVVQNKISNASVDSTE